MDGTSQSAVAVARRATAAALSLYISASSAIQ